MIQVNSGADDFTEFGERPPTLWLSGLVGCQIAGDDVGCAGKKWAEIPPAAQIDAGVQDFGLTEERIATWRELHLGRSSMAAVAVGCGVDQVASEANECRVLACQVQRHRRDFESSSDPRVIGVRLLLICAYRGRHDEHTNERCDQGNENYRGSCESIG